MISKSIENGGRANDEMPSPLMYLPIVLDLIVCQPPPPNISWSLENSEEENQFIEVEEEKTILKNSVLEGCLFYILQPRAENEAQSSFYCHSLKY